LEDHAEAAALGRQPVDPDAVEPDLAARRRGEPREQVERGGLAAPRGPEKGDELAAAHLKGQVVEDNLRAEALGEAEREARDQAIPEPKENQLAGRNGFSARPSYGCPAPGIATRTIVDSPRASPSCVVGAFMQKQLRRS